MLLYLAYNTREDILFVVCKLAKASICPCKANFCALIWLIGYLQQRKYFAIKFYPDTTSNPVYNVCCQHCIPQSNLNVFPNASWQDCPDIGCSTIGYILFHKANSTMPTPIAMSTSEAKYMVTAHICVLFYNMTYLGTTQWHESMQRLPTIPSILMIENKATVQITCN
jgi:hypothetical protein